MKHTAAVLMAMFLLIPASGCRQKEQEPLVIPDAPIEEVQNTPETTPEAKTDDSEKEYALMAKYELPEDQKVFIQSNMNKIMQKFQNKESFVLYMGQGNCNWCRHAVPVLYQSAQELESEIQYINMEDPYAWKTEDQRESYDAFIEIVNDYLKEDSEGKKHVYIPFVVFVRNDIVMDAHISTLDDDEGEEELTDEQKGELKQIYYSGIIRAGA